ncbi:amidohydrolase [Cumulibacter manganitolerans]|uniref:amidohydrolase n=1 Tax=Cumulibacter manganitolerans TaxID=1884992 RepID=UPI001296CE45|nr:amidohydrolase [Cumulibacter manganitolerans]
MTSALEKILAAQPSITDWQDDLYIHFHRNPELSFVEHQTHDRIAEELDRLDGVEVVRHIGETGLVGIVRNGDGPTVLMRADIDALPVRELTGLEYASTVVGVSSDGETSPVMHACGHDIHISSLLGATRLLTEHTDAWSGTFLALFQPAEERATGAEKMVDDGLVDRIPKPDVAFSQHVMPQAAGDIHANIGPAMSAADSMKITLFGRGGHGSMPQTTVDPAVLASLVVLRLQTIVARELAPHDFGVVTVGKMVVGSKVNIISDRAELHVNVRSFNEQTRAHILEAIERMVNAECEASGSPQPPTFEYYDQFPLTDNDEDVTTRVRSAFADAFGDRFIEATPSSGSEDFGAIPNAFGVPYCYWMVGGSDREAFADAKKRGVIAKEIPGNHSPFFAPVMHPTLDAATKAILVVATEWMPPAG